MTANKHKIGGRFYAMAVILALVLSLGMGAGGALAGRLADSTYGPPPAKSGAAASVGVVAQNSPANSVAAPEQARLDLSSVHAGLSAGAVPPAIANSQNQKGSSGSPPR